MFDLSNQNKTGRSILFNSFQAAISLFINGFGVYLTIHASIGAAPWDVFNLGLSKTLNILYGNASIIVSIVILVIDIMMREPIGIAMFIDAVTVGKTVDLFNWLNIIPTPRNMADSIFMMILGLFIMGYTQYFYMRASLGCGPRDTLLVGLKKRLKKVPIGVISIIMLSTVTAIGYFLGGQVGVGTLICAFCSGPIMQIAFRSVKFDPTKVMHQNVLQSVNVISGKKRK